MASFASQISSVLLFVLFTTTFNRVISCNENDEKLLLIFKQGVVDPYNQLSSWTTEEDCCLWEGVHCNNMTGRVTKLSLFNRTLRGDINLCVLQLEFLSHLDLSHNDFKTVSMPPCQISKSPFDAHKFHNQSLPTPSNQSACFSVALRYLDFSVNGLVINDLHWLSQLSSLKYLDLTNSDIGNENKWLHHISMLPSLSVLHLRGCGLTDFPSLDYINFTSLEILDLSFNCINSIPNSFFNITSNIYHLDLLGCNFYGQLPKALHHLQNLKHLNLSLNNLEGSIPDWICQHEQLQHFEIYLNQLNGSIPSCLGNLSSLISLDLSNNHFRGNLPKSLGKLHNLKSLSIDGNSWSGVLSEKNFANLSSLASLALSSTSFKFDFDPNWVPPFQLKYFSSANTSLGPNFPTWLYTQRSLERLQISRSEISNIDADILWGFIARIDEVDLSNNFISGDISNVTLHSRDIRLDYNNFTGGLPHISANVMYIQASHNSFSGSISAFLCPRESNRAQNMLSILDISHNNLSGSLPDCWAGWKQLVYLNLRGNIW
ncbi:receptor-like protein EIX1 [Neltuma alba]|uniref:receptor-like protein EIX1 n=1 Tax=Neltuma alba TaxID=207710 RepID=UPI0010A3B4BA|nr:receptor-like protein EIX1 [Prosopis alba]